MDAELFSQSIQYEQLTQSIYQAMFSKEGIENIRVERKVDLKGKSGVEHQIDVFWRFKQAGIEHKVLVECKNWTSNVTLEKVRSFFSVIDDIGNCVGIMVTKTGYQSGVVDFAKHNRIGLKLLREPTDDDWEGKVKDIHIEITAKTAVSGKEKPLKVELKLKCTDKDQEERLNNLKSTGKLNISLGPDSCLLDENGIDSTREFKWWLPGKLDVLNKENGGPYTQIIPTEGKFVFINQGESDQELIKIQEIVATYYVESSTAEINIYGEQIVEYILKDFTSGEVEYMKKNE